MVFGVIQFTDTTSVTVDLQSTVSEYQGLRPEMMRRIINPHLKYPRIANPRGEMRKITQIPLPAQGKGLRKYIYFMQSYYSPTTSSPRCHVS